MKNIIPIILGTFLFSAQLIAQTIISEKVIEKNTPHNTDFTFIARDKISLNPGFSINGVAGNDLQAYIDESLIFGVDYFAPEDIPDVDTRTIDKNLPVGTTNGAFNVSATGAATYTIPIFTPPGTAGVQPNVSISYNSQSGNGLLGMGWHISGLSVISRVPKTIYHDGYRGNIGMNQNDRFVLDGNRLITVGDYGGNGTTYKTEAHNFTTITSHDVNNNKSPESFTVVTKDGTTINYGGTATHIASDHISGGGYTKENIAWYIEKITDANGNYIKYYYHNNESTGEFWLTKITYTGNDIVGQGPYNEIVFLYETRTADKQILYISEYKIEQNVILRGIRVNCENKLVRSYEFNYSDEFYTHLNEIFEFDGSGNRLNSTIVNWGAKSSDYQVNAASINTDFSANYYLLDVNSDGRTDVVRFPKLDIAGNYTKDYHVYFSNSTGTNFSFQQTIDYRNVNNNTYATTHVGDFNGDGHHDLLAQRFGRNNDNEINGVYFDLIRSNGSLLGNIEINKINQPEPNHPKTNGYFSGTGDFNGDGITDVVVIQTVPGEMYIGSTRYFKNHVRLFIGSSSAVFTKYEYDLIAGPTGQNYNPMAALSSLITEDFNGDGKTDLLFLMGNNSRLFKNVFGEGVPSTAHFTNEDSKSDGFFNDVTLIYFGDFNGDGNKDRLQYDISSGWKVWINIGTQFNNPIVVPLTMYGDDPYSSCFLADFNGDGRDDIFETYRIFIGSTESKIAKIHYLKRDNTFYTEDVSGIFDNNNLNLFKKTAPILVGDFNGDGKADIFHKKIPLGDGNESIYSFHRNENRHLVKFIANGFNERIYIDYLPITNNTVYKAGLTVNYPLNIINAPMHVVNCFSTPNGIGGTQYTYYDYEGAQIHKLGKGFLGFQKVIVNNITTNNTLETTTEINASNFLLKKQTIKNYKTNLVSTTINTYSYINKSDLSYFSYPDSSTVTNHLTGVTILSDNTYNTNGEIISQTTSAGGNSVNTTFTNYTAHGKPQYITVTKKGPDDPNNFVVQTRLIYDSDGKLTSKIEYNNKPNPVTTTYSSFNPFGHPTVVTKSATGVNTQTITNTFDSKGRFITSKSNALGVESYTYIPHTGQISTATDINNNTSRYVYNGFGGLQNTTSADGITTVYNMSWAPSNSFYALYMTDVMAPGAPEQKTYYDCFGRKVKSESDSYNGTIAADNTFNYKGQLIKETYPYLVSQGAASVPFTTYTYDIYDRPTNTTSNGLATSITYSGLRTTTTLPSGEVIMKYVDDFGKEVTTADAGGYINYYYNSNGNLQRLTAPGSATTMTYDTYGFQETLTDPDAGLSEYDYNAFGQLTRQQNANGVNSMSYDNLGRITQEITPDGIYLYNYVSSGNGIGQLKEITKDNVVQNSYNYDKYGRVLDFTEKVGDLTLTTSYEYDSYGRVHAVNYPENFGVVYSYDNIGTLEEIRTAAGALIWKLEAINNDGQISQYGYGNGLSTTLTFDSKKMLSGINTGSIQNLTYNFNASKGQLTSRRGLVKYIDELFTYDNQNQLTSVYAPAMQALNQTIQYDNGVVGNIVYKSDVGNFTYGESAGPHAVTSIAGEHGLYTQAVQNITYTWFNQVENIQQDNYSIDFSYGTERQRTLMDVKYNGTTTRKVYYSGNYERHIENGVTRHLYYIHATNGLVAIYKKEGTSQETFYVHTDHLGSIQTVTNASATVVGRYYYDAWGKQRELTLLGGSFSTTENLAWLERGYTGHEHIKEVELINMNGRLQDPIVGRFLSPDNYVQSLDRTGSFNRFAYCLNNPLMYTDPSGEIVWFVPIIIGAAIGSYAGYQIGKASGAEGWEMAGYIGGGAVIGGVSGGAAIGISAAGGGAALAGAGAGAISGAGFKGMASNWDAKEMIKGGLIGAASGFVGGGVGSAIGGGGGAFAGGFAADATGQLLGTGEVNLGRSLIAGGVSFGMYHGFQFAQWKWGGGNKIGIYDITYKQFSKVNTMYQRSQSWLGNRDEGGVVLNYRGKGKDWGTFVKGADRYQDHVDFSKYLVRGKAQILVHSHVNNSTTYAFPSHSPEASGGIRSDVVSLRGYHSLVVSPKGSSTMMSYQTSPNVLIHSSPYVKFFLFPWLNY